MSWSEVKQAKKEERYELVLSGSAISERLSNGGLDSKIFQLTRLNFLQISNTTLKHVPNEIGNLVNLKTLDLHRNAIEEIPSSIAQMKEVKVLDFSGNCLKELPQEIGQFEFLQTLNLNCNELAVIPSLEKAKNLARLDVSHNKLTDLPEGIFQLEHIAEIRASSNAITSLGEGVAKLQVLKTLDLSENKIQVVPEGLADCLKLKDLNLKENSIKDNRLGKLIKQCSTKAILDYVATACKDKGKGKKGGKKGRNKRASESEKDVAAEDGGFQGPSIRVLHSESVKIFVQPAVLDVRPYVVCAVVKDLDLSDSATFKKFITIQSKLHENLCDNRTQATIATHSLDALTLPLTYDAGSPTDIELLPLGRQKSVKAEELVNMLKAEALKQKQKTKRNPLKSGLYKYLSLIEGATLFAYLKDASDAIVSLPPVTNSEASKIKAAKADILIEVTSSKELAICKQVMDTLVQRMLEAGMSSMRDDAGEAMAAAPAKPQLILQQVRVLNHEGQIRVVYPSHVDLHLDGIKVVHEQ